MEDSDFSDGPELDEEELARLEEEAIKNTQAIPFATAGGTHYTPPSTHDVRPTTTNAPKPPLRSNYVSCPPSNLTNNLIRHPLGQPPTESRPLQTIPTVPCSRVTESYGRRGRPSDYNNGDHHEVGMGGPARITAPTLQVNSKTPYQTAGSCAFKFEDSQDERLPVIDFTENLHYGVDDNAGGTQHNYDSRKEDEEKEALRQELENMRREKARLEEDLKAKTTEVYTKAGEAASLRDKATLEKKEFEKMVETLRKQKEVERERAVVENERLKKEMERAQTEMAFMKKNMDDLGKKNKELEKVRTSSQRPPPVMGGLNQSPQTTPRKNRAMAYRDGFDNRESVQMSPTKAKGLGRSPSGRKSKRKRPEMDSPIKELPITQTRSPLFTAVHRKPDIEVDEKMLERLHVGEDNIEFMEAFQAVTPPPFRRPSLEALARYAVPDKPSMSFATLFIQRMVGRPAEVDFIAATCLALVKLWRVCYDAEYWDPHVSIVWLFRFCLDWVSTRSISLFLDDFCDVAQGTVAVACDLRTESEGNSSTSEGLDVTGSLEAMLHIGMLAHSNRDLQQRFYDKLQAGLCFSFLKPRQELGHIRLMLQILTLTIRPDSFGPKVLEKDIVAGSELTILKLLGTLLYPGLYYKGIYTDPDFGRPHAEVTEMRIAILRFISKVAETASGSQRISDHPNFICYVIHRLSVEVQEMYSFRSGVEKSVTFINAAIRLLWEIITKHEWQLAERFAELTNTTEHFLVSITRVAYSERLVQEKGLEPAVVKKAEDLMGLGFTADESDRLEELFRSRWYDMMEMDDPELEME